MAYNGGYYMGFPTTKLKEMPYKVTQSTTSTVLASSPGSLIFAMLKRLGSLAGDEATTVLLTRKDKLSFPEIYPSITWMHGDFC